MPTETNSLTGSTNLSPLDSVTSRRGLLRVGTVLGGAGLLTATPAGKALGHRVEDDPMVRKPILVGANPGMQLFGDDGACTAYLSTWVVDWSTHGSGTAMVLWQPEGVRVRGESPHLALWLAESFVRHFPELEGLPWPAPQFRRSKVRVSLDLASGMQVRGGEISARMSHVLDRRAFATDAFPLAGVAHSLSLVLAPCARARALVAGHRLAGDVSVGGTADRPSSSAFLTAAEVWRR